MFSLGKTVSFAACLVWLCVGVNSQDSNYFFADQQPRFLQNYQTQNDFGNQQDVSHFRPSETFRPLDPFLQSDLQTSDLPPHLQQTLPQYRFSGLPITTKEPSGFKLPNYHQSFKQSSDRSIPPSTHRPNYSHLFSKIHDPRTETFLGQITLDSPAELPPEFSRFRSATEFQRPRTPPPPASEWSANKPRFLNTQDNVNQNLDYTEKPKVNAVSFGKPTRNNFLNHRTRIFAPSSDEEYKKPLVKDYFITNDGNILLTTKKSKTTTTITTTTEPSFESIRVSKLHTPTESNLESLLEEPINSKESSKHGKQDVEVIQSITVPPDQLYTLPQEDYEDEEELSTDDYDYDANTNKPHTYDTNETNTDKEQASENQTNGQYSHEERPSEQHPNETNNTNKTSSEEFDSINNNDNEAHNDETTNKTIAGKPLTTTEEAKKHEKVTPVEEHDYSTYDEYEETEDSTEEIKKEDDNSNQPTIIPSTFQSIPEATTILEITTLKVSNKDHQREIEESLKAVKENDIKPPKEISSETPSQNEIKKQAPSEVHEKSEEEIISDAQEEISAEDNDLHEEDDDEDAEYEDDGGKEDLNEIPDPKQSNDNNKTYEIITMKPIAASKSESFQDFTDTESIDATDPTLLTTNSNEETKLDKNKMKPHKNDSVVSISVVTTKSVINNTVIGTVTPLPMTTQQMIVQSENSTDSWIVIASVQTSRSVSGARYIPSGIVEQQERKAFLGGKERTLIETPEEDITTVKSSTESLIDKLDRVQSDLSSKYLPSQFKNDDNNYIISNGKDDMLVVDTTTSSTTTTTTARTTTLPPVKIRKFSPAARPTTTKPKRTFQIKPFPRTTESPLDVPQGDQPFQQNGTTGRSSGLPSKTKVAVQDVTSFLPTGYKPPKEENQSSSNLLEELLNKVKIQDPTALLPPGYKGDVSSLLPPGYKIGNNNTITSTTTLTTTASTTERTKATSTTKKSKADDLINSAVPIDISHFIPKGYKVDEGKETTKNKSKNIFDSALQENVSKFLPPGYSGKTTPKSRVANSPEGNKNKTKDQSLSGLFEDAKSDDLSKFLPPDYNKFKFAGRKPSTTTTTTTTTTEAASTTPPTTRTEAPANTSSSNSFKIVFPSRPGQNRKAVRLTTPKPIIPEFVPPSTPSIQKGWPSRATTEFTGWPTPSTTPISIEKLLAAAKDMASSTTTTTTSTTASTTTTTTTTTTTAKPTTPGICDDDCELGGTIKLVGGAKWVPELLDRNTKEWQILANEVQSQLERVYSQSNVLNKWYRKIRIDAFSEGSVLVDYVVMLDDIGREINTQELKKIFHDSLDDGLKASNREPKSTNLSDSEKDDRLTLGDFIVDPKYTDFVVLPPPAVVPTVGYAEDDVLLPQWAIAVIVIGLASLLFVIIFGVTVLVNRQKNNKKKQPIPLTEDMINELNKNHMGGIDNYGADDLYNMEDVWNDRPYDIKPKKRSSGSIHDNSMSNLYDSWRSEWNGYYYNAYYANNPGSSRRRSDYDTNF